MHMGVCQVHLGGPWQFDRNTIHDGKKNTYTFEKDGRKHTLIPMKDEESIKHVSPKMLMVSGKEFQLQIKNEEVNFSLIGKPRVTLTSTKFTDLPIEI